MRLIRSIFWLAVSCTVVGVLGGVLIAWLITLTRPEVFTASSSLRVVPSKIPARFVPATQDLTVEAVMDSVVQDLDARSGLSAALESEGLLNFERAGMSRVNFLKLLRQRIDVRVGANHTLTLSNSDTDRARAVKMNHVLVSHVVNEIVRRRGSESRMATDFLREQADRAALHWEAVDEQLRKATGAKAERLRLDLNLATREYEEIGRMVGEAKILAELETRKQGPTIEVVELSSAPDEPTNESHRAMYVFGAIAGGVLGFVGAVATRVRFV